MPSLVFNNQYNLDISQLFTPTSVRTLCTRRLPAVMRGILRHGTTGLSARTTLADIYDAAYAHLVQSHRTEYVYKNAIAAHLLLARHSLSEARLFTEFSSDDSIADVVIVNGTTTAYEVKTEYDSLVRLPKQLASYCRTFEYVYVVTSPSLAAAAAGVAPKWVGVLELRPSGALRLRRPARSNMQRMRVRSIFTSLRQAEYLSILREVFGGVPSVPNGEIYAASATLFDRLTRARAHQGLVAALRARALPPAVAEAALAGPSSLVSAILSANLRNSEAPILLDFLRTRTPRPS